MIEHNLLIGKLYELNLVDNKRKIVIISTTGKIAEKIGSQEPFVLLGIRANPRDTVLILEILTSTGNVGMTAVCLEELKILN